MVINCDLWWIDDKVWLSMEHDDGDDDVWWFLPSYDNRHEKAGYTKNVIKSKIM